MDDLDYPDYVVRSEEGYCDGRDEECVVWIAELERRISIRNKLQLDYDTWDYRYSILGSEIAALEEVLTWNKNRS